MKKFFQELQRRNVIKATLSYVVISWAVLQVAAIIFPIFAGDKAMRILLAALAIGFPFWVVFAYVFELTPSGFKKTSEVAPEHSMRKSTGKRLNAFIIGGLSIAVVLLLVDRIFDLTGTEVQSVNKSIAVLPFTNISNDPTQEYLGDGLAEEILNSLTKIPEINVISRTSAFSFKGQNLNMTAIANKLGVTHILAGSVRKSDETVRITVKLIEAKRDKQLWSETWDRDIKDIFVTQDEIANSVISSLKLNLLKGARIKTVEPDPKAYTLYLQAKHLENQRSSEGLTKAGEFIKKSLSIDSTYAPSWDLLSRILYSEANTLGIKPVIESSEIARSAAKKSLALNNEYLPAYATLAKIYMTFDWDFEATNGIIEKAFTLGLENEEIIIAAADLDRNLGKFDESIRLYEKAIKLNPISYDNYSELRMAYLMAGRLDDAIDAMQKALSFNPNAGSGHSRITEILVLQGKFDEALKEAEKETDDGWSWYAKSLALTALERPDEASDYLSRFIERYPRNGGFQIATVYAFRQENDKAFEWLELAYGYHDAGLIQMRHFPFFRSLHNDPRWQEMLDKVGFSELD